METKDFVLGFAAGKAQGGEIKIEYYDYLEFTGQGKIALPFTVNEDYKITVDFDIPQYRGNNSVIGNSNGAKYVHLTQYSNRYYCSTGSSETNFSDDLTGRHTYVVNQNGKTLFDGEEKTNYTPTTNNVFLWVGARADPQPVYFIGKIYSYKIESIQTGEILCELKAAKQIYKGKTVLEGFFDTVSGSFYTSANTQVGND